MSLNNNWILSIYISRHSVSFMCMTTGRVLLEFGNKDIEKDEKKHKVAVQHARSIIKFHRPATLVLEGPSKKRPKEIWYAYDAIAKSARSYGIAVYRYTRGDIQSLFKAHGAKNKHEMNQIIIQIFPAIRFKFPPKRRTWESEPYRQSLYDAASLAVVYIVRESGFVLACLEK